MDFTVRGCDPGTEGNMMTQVISQSAGPEPAILKWYGHFIAVTVCCAARNFGFRSFPGLFLSLGTRLMPRVCAASRHFEVERKCELVETLDLVYINHGH